jgi:hypothetical protein
MGRTEMHPPEDVIAKLRQAKVLLGHGKTEADAVRSITATEPTCWAQGSYPRPEDRTLRG